MNTFVPFDGASDPERRNTYQPLADWLLHILATPEEEGTPQDERHDAIASASRLRQSNYHLEFYQQLPDFIMALLRNNSQSILAHASLLYHLVGCSACHTAYLELYDAMRFAIETGQDDLVPLGVNTRPLAGMPSSMLIHFCQLFIAQAEALLRQGRHDHSDQDEAARALLQQAMRAAASITQTNVRARALQDLVRVATLFDGPGAPTQPEPGTLSYTPALAGAGFRRGAARADDIAPEKAAIYLQDRQFEGVITQRDTELELRLHRLDPALRGHRLSVSVPLGSLIEPVQWRGGNPRAIHSDTQVDTVGAITVPLGSTEMRLDNEEDRELLEIMFSLLEVRVGA